MKTEETNEDGVAVAPEKYAAGEGGNFRATQPPGKKSRRAVLKRVVSVPVGDAEGLRGKNGAGGEVFPPMDTWAWRKYGQKPIKGSPFPRGYYRCSSCKGCPARKQVERSQHDPTTLVVTYSFEHNHPGPLPKSTRRHHAPPLLEAGREEEKCLTSAEEEEDPLASMMTELEDVGEFRWFPDVGSPSSTSARSDELLYGSVLFRGGGEVGLVPEEREMAEAGEGEEDGLFAGLGELPEYSVVLRRGMAAAPWSRTTG